MGVSENRGVPYFGVLIIRTLLLRVLYQGLLLSETPKYQNFSKGFRHWGLGVLLGFEFRLRGSWGLGFQGLGFRFQGLGFRDVGLRI